MTQEINIAIKTEQERMKILQQTELDALQREWKLELESQKKVYQRQNEVLSDQLKQQIEMQRSIDQIKGIDAVIETSRKKLGAEQERSLLNQLDDLEKKEKNILERITSTINDDLMLDEEMKRIEEAFEAQRVKESKIKVQFERQMEDIKTNAKLISDAHSRQMFDIEATREDYELEQRKAEMNMNRIQMMIQEKEQQHQKTITDIHIKKKVIESEQLQHRDLIQTERENMSEKIKELDYKEEELAEEERDFETRLDETLAKEDELSLTYNQLKERRDGYEDERVRFEEEAQQDYAFSIEINQMSQHINQFRESYAKLQDELE